MISKGIEFGHYNFFKQIILFPGIFSSGLNSGKPLLAIIFSAAGIYCAYWYFKFKSSSTFFFILDVILSTLFVFH